MKVYTIKQQENFACRTFTGLRADSLNSYTCLYWCEAYTPHEWNLLDERF